MANCMPRRMWTTSGPGRAESPRPSHRRRRSLPDPPHLRPRPAIQRLVVQGGASWALPVSGVAVARPGAGGEEASASSSARSARLSRGPRAADRVARRATSPTTDGFGDSGLGSGRRRSPPRSPGRRARRRNSPQAPSSARWAQRAQRDRAARRSSGTGSQVVSTSSYGSCRPLSCLGSRRPGLARRVRGRAGTVAAKLVGDVAPRERRAPCEEIEKGAAE